MIDEGKKPGWRDDETLISGKNVAPAGSPTLPGYEFLGEIHRGGQGIVYLAIQKSTKRRVAVKFMRQGPFAGAEDQARFQREVEILARLEHPGIVAIHDCGVAADGSSYFVMDYVEGVGLGDYLAQAERSDRAAIRRLLALFAEICQAVGAAHEQRVIHRDLKPSNIRIDAAGKPRVLDFGLAKFTPGAAQPDSDQPVHSITGEFMGSLPWASPEQARGRIRTLDARSDVYSLGVLLYQMLTDSFPYNVLGPPHEVLQRIIESPPSTPRSRNKAIDRDVETIILKALQKDPQRRYGSAVELGEDVTKYLSGDPIGARRDSFLYRASKINSKVMRRHTVSCYAAAFALSILLAYFINQVVLYRVPAIDRAYRRLAVSLLPAKTEVFEFVRVIGMTDESRIMEIAEREGLWDISTANKASVRRLHGRLLKRLAMGAPRVVVIDIAFRTESPFDEDLVEGIRALRASGVPVVLDSPSWKLDPQGQPEISSKVLPEARWGSGTADLSAQAPWALELAMQRGDEEPRSSLALAAVAAYRHPDTEYVVRIENAEDSLRLNERPKSCEVRYWKPHPSVPRTRQWLTERDRISVTGFLTQADPVGMRDLIPGDLLAFYMLQMPPDQVLQAGTLDYGIIFREEPSRWRDQISGRVVLIADQRPGVDLHKHSDGREISGSYAHAVGIDSILKGLPTSLRNNILPFLLPTMAAGFGLLLGRWQSRRAVSRIAWLLLLTAAVATTSVLGYPLTECLCNPTMSILAAIMVCEFAAGIRAVGLNHS